MGNDCTAPYLSTAGKLSEIQYSGRQHALHAGKASESREKSTERCVARDVICVYEGAEETTLHWCILTNLSN